MLQKLMKIIQKKEEKIIKKALLKIGCNNKKFKNIKEAKKIEKNSNQILDFTKEVVKNMEKK